MRLEFVSAGAAQGLITTVAKQSGVEVAGPFGAVGAMLEKFRAGEPCDVVILTRAQVSALIASREALAGTDADLGGAPTAIAVRAVDPSPPVDDEKNLRAALLAADAIYFPDPG